MPISYSRYQFPFRLIILNLTEFDIILGMDWLDRYEAKLDCSRRIVSVKTQFDNFIQIPCEDPNVREDSLCCALDTSLTTLETIPVVKEFPDIF